MFPFKNKLVVSFLLILTLLPLLYINVKNTHDWGDDFAQYIIQAKNIFSQTHYQPDVSGLENYSPQFRPIGFPLLLAPFYIAFGTNMYVFMLFISGLLILLCLQLFRFFNFHFDIVLSFLLVLVFAYNPAVLAFKSEVMAEIPFSLFLISGVLIYIQKEKNYLLYTLLIACALMLIKYIGVVFIFAVATDKLVKYFINKQEHKQSFSFNNFFRIAFYVFLPLAFYVLINHFVFNIPFGSEGWYNKFIVSNNLFTTMCNNFIYYKDVFVISFEQEVPQYINVFLKTSVLVFLLIGIILRFFRKKDFCDYVFLFYLIIILIYPYTCGGYKFILPIIPFLLVYTFSGMKFFFSMFTFRSYLPLIMYALLILCSYSINIKTIVKETPNEQTGPQDKEFTECIDYIHSNTTSNDCFVFVKPWAFNLYAERKVVPLAGHTEELSFTNCLHSHHVNYILACNNPNYELFDKKLLELVSDQKNYKEIWKNACFTLYKKE